MFTKEVINKINDFVAQKPRTIQELSQLVGKNWHTTESYVQRIIQEQGTLAMRTFREGTRGALKIVYWNVLGKNQSSLQEMLFQRIINSKRKEEFSPFDIYQYVEENSRQCFLEKQEKNLNIKQDLIGSIKGAQQQVLLFSGDLSWSQAKQEEVSLLKGFEELVKKNVPVKILANVDLNSLSNVQKMQEINHKYGKELIEIRHCIQPLRAFVVDNQFVRLKEKYFLKSAEANNYLFYSINDQEWINWMQKIFWYFFSTSISAEKRLTDLKTIKEM